MCGLPQTDRRLHSAATASQDEICFPLNILLHKRVQEKKRETENNSVRGLVVKSPTLNQRSVSCVMRRIHVARLLPVTQDWSSPTQIHGTVTFGVFLNSSEVQSLFPFSVIRASCELLFCVKSPVRFNVMMSSPRTTPPFLTRGGTEVSWFKMRSAFLFFCAQN